MKSGLTEIKQAKNKRNLPKNYEVGPINTFLYLREYKTGNSTVGLGQACQTQFGSVAGSRLFVLGRAGMSTPNI